MSDTDDIYSALQAGLRSVQSLTTWADFAHYPMDAHETCRHREITIERGIAAWERLSAQLRDGRKHIECASYSQPTECYCNATPMPPCGFCENSAKDKSP